MSGGQVRPFFLPGGKGPGLATVQTAEMHFHVVMATAGEMLLLVLDTSVFFCCVSPELLLRQVIVINHHGDNV